MDKIQEFNERLKEVSECYASWKANGISDEIMITWLMVKLKVSNKKARRIVDCYGDFFTELLRKEMIEKLEE